MALQRRWAHAVAIDDAANEILRNLPKLDEGALLAMADTFRGADGAATHVLRCFAVGARGFEGLFSELLLEDALGAPFVASLGARAAIPSPSFPQGRGT